MPDGRHRRRAWLHERGAAAVELALILPVFCVLLFGMLDFGRAVNYWIDETHLANEAARWAVVDRNPGPGGSLEHSIFQQIITEELKGGGTVSGPTGTATVCVDFPGKSISTAGVGDPVRVRVTSNFRFLAVLGLASIPLRGEATMRIEKKPTAATHEADLCYP